MSETIRTVRPDELERLRRFLERCYGFKRGWNDRHSPDLFLPTEEACDCWLIVEREGRIASHVGTYPLAVVVGPARVMVGAIGDVGTHPEERGRGHMSRLVEASVARMRERGWPLSVLWGDRRRYGRFGWETCGLQYALQLNRPSLERRGVAPAEIAEVDPRDPEVVARITALHATLPYRVERTQLALQLLRSDTRVFLGPEGYLLSGREYHGDPQVLEVASPTGREAELILGTMDWTFGGGAEVRLGAGEGDRLERLARVMSHWSLSPQGLFRIIDWPLLLQSLQPLLRERAEGLPPFTSCLGCRWQDEVQWATVAWDGSDLAVEAGPHGEGTEVELPLLTALLLGGPHASPGTLGLFGRLLPVPIHLPPLDHV